MPRGCSARAAHVSLIRKASPESNLVWPAQAPAGLWTTAGDLARLVIAIQQSHAGDGDFLPRVLAIDALTKQTPHKDIGLGVYLLGEGAARRFSHMGGYLGFCGEILGWLAGGYGVAILLNNGYTGPALKAEIQRAVETTFAWPG